MGQYLRSRFPHRLAALLLAFGAAVLASVNVRHLMAERLAAAARSDAGKGAAAVGALELAASLDPSDARRHADLAWAEAATGAAPYPHAHMLQALRLAPADALRWTELAQMVASTHQGGSMLEHATATAIALAPNAPSIHAAHAMNGVYYWPWGTPRTQELWLESLRQTLGRRRARFLDAVSASGRIVPFCAAAAPRLDLQSWCRKRIAALTACASGNAQPKARRGCPPTAGHK